MKEVRIIANGNSMKNEFVEEHRFAIGCSLRFRKLNVSISENSSRAKRKFKPVELEVNYHVKANYSCPVYTLHRSR